MVEVQGQVLAEPEGQPLDELLLPGRASQQSQGLVEVHLRGQGDGW